MFGIRFSTASGELKHLKDTPSLTGVPVGSRRKEILSIR